MSATIIVVGRFAAGYEEYFAEYSARVRAFLQSKGAVTVRRQRIEQTLYGSDPADLVMLIDFPARETARDAFFEPAYLELIPLRDKVFSEFRMYVATSGEI